MKILAALLGAALLTGPAGAQSLLDSLEAEAGARAEELRRAEELLRTADPNRRLAVAEALLASGDPAFVQKAKEVTLFSEDPQLRAAGIRAVLDAGGPLRAEFEIPTEQDGVTDIYTWLTRFGGSWSQDGTRGYFGFVIDKYDAGRQCWTFLETPGSRDCAFRLSGDEVTTVDWSSNTSGSASMRLDEGVLTGAFVVNGRGRPVTIRIPLIN